MSDYSNSKPIETTGYPVHANGTSGLLSRVEPLITPKLLRSRHLKGIIELARRYGVEWSDDELKDRIKLAVNELEVELKCPVFPEQIKERQPFDRNLYFSFVHIRTEQGPILSIENLAIEDSNRTKIYNMPFEWIETGNFHQRLINVVPLLSAYGGAFISGAATGAGAAFLTLLGHLAWVPAYWSVTYTAGLCKDAGQIPIVVNQLIGVYAAIDVLSSIAPNNPNNSVSLGQDGISQSTSSGGPQIFVQRIQELEAKKQVLLKQLRRVFASKYFISNI